MNYVQHPFSKRLVTFPAGEMVEQTLEKLGYFKLPVGLWIAVGDKATGTNFEIVARKLATNHARTR